MGHIEKGNQSTQLQQAVQTGSDAEKSFADFFKKLGETLDQLKNAYPKPEDPKLAKRFEVYSQAYQGFAQNNVSKSEGFSIKVKTDPQYDALTRKLINRKRIQDDDCYNLTGQGDDVKKQGQ